MTLTSISNNIGIAQVSFKAYQTETLTVLNGTFTVDPTSAEWQAASEIEFCFSDLVMLKSNVSQVYIKDSQEGPQYAEGNRGTVLRSWIRNNKLVIEKVSKFDGNGVLTVIVCSAYVTGAQRVAVVKEGFVTTGITNQPTQCYIDKKYLMVRDAYVFGVFTFTKFKPNTGETTQQFDITGMPTDVTADICVVYPNSATSQEGAVVSLGHIENGHFSTDLPGNSTFYSNSGTFFMFFAVREVAEAASDSSSETGSDTGSDSADSSSTTTE